MRCAICLNLIDGVITRLPLYRQHKKASDSHCHPSCEEPFDIHDFFCSARCSLVMYQRKFKTKM